MTTSEIAPVATPPRAAPSISGTIVVIPTYNEVDTIRTTVPAALANGDDFHVLVVDDSSPDGTADVVRAVAEQHPGRVHLLVRATKDGLGGAYRAGFAWSLARPYRNVAQMDADGSHPAEQLRPMVAQIDAGGPDVVVGSRYVAGGEMPGWPLRRRALSAGANAYARTVLRLGQHDATAGFKVWRREALLLVEPSRTRSDGYGFQVELSLAAQRAGLAVAEHPISFADRMAGTSKLDWRVALEGLFVVWRMRRGGQVRSRRIPITV